MKSKKRLLKDSYLYTIVDSKTCDRGSLFNIVNKIKACGSDIIQFRDKESKKEVVLENSYMIRNLLQKKGIIFIINDYLDVAKVVDSDGIHLGQNDTPIEIARKILGRDKIIGISCHSLHQAINAQDRGADYISIGPIFPTPTKPEYKAVGLNLIKQAKKSLKIPFFVIGGINFDNINLVLSCGAKRIAVCRAICLSKDIIGTTKKFYYILN